MIVKVEGMDELNRILRNMPDAVKRAAEKSLELAALDLQAKAADIAPNDTGDLSGSGFVSVGWRNEVKTITSHDRDPSSRRLLIPETKGLEAIVGFAEPYALAQHEHVEWHHPKRGQAKYLETPFKENISKYITAIGNTIKEGVE